MCGSTAAAQKRNGYRRYRHPDSTCHWTLARNAEENWRAVQTIMREVRRNRVTRAEQRIKAQARQPQVEGVAVKIRHLRAGLG